MARKMQRHLLQTCIKAAVSPSPPMASNEAKHLTLEAFEGEGKATALESPSPSHISQHPNHLHSHDSNVTMYSNPSNSSQGLPSILNCRSNTQEPPSGKTPTRALKDPKNWTVRMRKGWMVVSKSGALGSLLDSSKATLPTWQKSNSTTGRGSGEDLGDHFLKHVPCD